MHGLRVREQTERTSNFEYAKNAIGLVASNLRPWPPANAENEAFAIANR